MVPRSIDFPAIVMGGDDPPSHGAAAKMAGGDVDWGASKAISACAALAGSNVYYIAKEKKLMAGGELNCYHYPVINFR
jgi:hypothetical protein